MIAQADEQRALRAVVERSVWIIDGKYGSTMPLRFAAADTIIFLDFSTLVCLWRIVKRYWHYRGRTRPGRGADCPEKLDWSFVGWILRYRQVNRPKVMRLMRAHTPTCSIYIFRNPKQVTTFVGQLPATHAP